MDMYLLCTPKQQEIFHRFYDYFGFNEVSSFEEFLYFMFLNAKNGVQFESIINYTLKHIIISMKNDLPAYKNYIKYFWLKEKDLLEHMNVGSKIEYDPRGVVRLYIKNNFKKLLKTKV